MNLKMTPIKPPGRLRLIYLLFGIFLSAPTAAAIAAEFKESEWERTVATAKKEGKLSLYLYQGDGELEGVAQAFQKKYPEIAVTTVPGRGNQLGPRIMAERRAGKYLVDVYIGGPTTPYTVFYPAKILDPIPSALILPEVTDASKWWEGRHHYLDPENKHIFVFVGSTASGYVSYNSKLVNPREFSSYWDLLQPKWKGKVLSKDPKVSGSQRIAVRMLYYTPGLGPEYLRRLYSEMDIVLSQDIRQSTDWLANGRFAVCFFCSDIRKARQQGLPVDEFVTARWKEAPAISAGSAGSLVLPSQPPNPNAAKVFINWLLSREGQIAYQKVSNTPINTEESMRIDLPKDMIPVEDRRVDGVKYQLFDRPEFMDMKPIYETLDKALAEKKK
jgi:iron(III) transport system substrate-binding protein